MHFNGWAMPPNKKIWDNFLKFSCSRKIFLKFSCSRKIFLKFSYSIKILLKFSCSRKIFFKYFSKFLFQEKIFLKFSCNYNFRAFPIQYSCHIFSKINLDPIFNKQGILMKRMFLKKSQKFIFHRIIPQKYTKIFNSEVKQRRLVLGWGDRKSIYFRFLKFPEFPPGPTPFQKR